MRFSVVFLALFVASVHAVSLKKDSAAQQPSLSAPVFPIFKLLPRKLLPFKRAAPKAAPTAPPTPQEVVDRAMGVFTTEMNGLQNFLKSMVPKDEKMPWDLFREMVQEYRDKSWGQTMCCDTCFPSCVPTKMLMTKVMNLSALDIKNESESWTPFLFGIENKYRSAADMYASAQESGGISRPWIQSVAPMRNQSFELADSNMDGVLSYSELQDYCHYAIELTGLFQKATGFDGFLHGDWACLNSDFRPKEAPPSCRKAAREPAP
jgi:hypothetical protein